jgi:hypothetical protein
VDSRADEHPKEQAMDKPFLDVNERLDGLERELRRLAWLGTAVLAGFLVPLAGATDLFRRPREVALRDRTGQLRARLAQDGDDAELAFHDPQGRPQARLQAMANGTSSLSLFDLGRVRLFLMASPDGPASLSFIDTGEGPKSRSELFMGADGTTGLDLGNDRLSVVTAVQPDGLGGVFVSDQDGTERGRVGALPEGVTCPSLVPVGIGKPLFLSPYTSGPPRDPDPAGGQRRPGESRR